MKKTRPRRYREDLSEMPDWLKKKKCRTGTSTSPASASCRRTSRARRSCADLIDDAFLAYNSARLQEGCQLFAEKMLEPDVTVGMSLSGALTPAGLGCSVDRPADQGRLRRLDRRHRREPLPRPALRPQLPACASGSFKMDDTELRNNDIVRIYDVLLGYSDCLMATDEILREHPGAAGVPEGDGHGRAALPAGQVRRRVGAQGGPQGRLGAGGGLSRRRAAATPPRRATRPSA